MPPALKCAGGYCKLLNRKRKILISLGSNSAFYGQRPKKNCTYSGRGKTIHTVYPQLLSREILCIQQEAGRVAGRKAAKYNGTHAFNHVSGYESRVSHRIVPFVILLY